MPASPPTMYRRLDRCRFSPCPSPPSIPVLIRSGRSRSAGTRSPISSASCCGWLYARALIRSRAAVGRQGAADRRRFRRLHPVGDARHHPRRPARLRAVLQSRLFRRASARDPAALEGRHVVPRRLPRLRDRGDRLFARWRGISILSLGDIVCAVAPIGLFLGRIANFINAELWGRTTDVPWALVFPGGGPLPRHPSQLYEATLEGLVLFVVLALLMRAGALKRPGIDPRRVLPRLRARADDLRILPRARSAARLPVGRADHGNAAVAAADARRHRPDRRRARATPQQAASRHDDGRLSAAGSRNPPAHQGRRPDAGRAIHDAVPHPSASTATTSRAIRSAPQGDFITAPEISQMFGELIGLWAAATWRAMGAPENVRLVELGPGRGTMMLDALRAVQRRCRTSARRWCVHMVEISPALEQRQRQALAGDRRAGRVASIARRGAGRPDHHPRQRVLRRAAGAPGGDVRRRLARARDQDRRRRQAAVRHRPRSDPAVRPDAAARAAQRADRRDLRMARRPDRARDRPPRRAFAAAPRWSSTTATPRAPPATPCRRSARHAFANPLQSPGHGRPHRPCRFPGAGACRRRHGRARARPGRPGRVPAPARHRDPRRGAQEGRAARQERRDQQRAARA